MKEGKILIIEDDPYHAELIHDELEIEDINRENVLMKGSLF